MKNIAIITWINYPNYGTYLQAYALQQYIKSLGYNCKILNDKDYIASNFNWKFEIKKILWGLKEHYRNYRGSWNYSLSLYESFKNKYLNIENIVNDSDYLNKQYDAFVCGSDQIWNPFFLSNSQSKFYYADFAYKRKIAYAPSIGVSEIPLQYKTIFKELTKNFEFLSSREQQGVDALHELTGKDASKVVDPTLLLNAEQWDMLLSSSEACDESDYILAYFLTPNPNFIQMTLKYAIQRGLKLKIFYTDKSYYNYNCDLVSAGPIEFMFYIKNATCLFTDSFHGSIFASIFHTQFFTFKRFKQTARSQNSRVVNLLNMMGISERLLDEDNCETVYKLSDIDFEQVDYNLAPLIKKSKEYIEKALQ